MLDKVNDISKKNSGWKEFREEIRKGVELSYDNMPIEERNRITNSKEYIDNLTDQTVAQFRSPWMQYFISYDPVPALSNVTCPVLMMFGGKDLQVPVKQNEKPMLDALKKGGNKDYISKTMPTANHLFQPAITGSPGEYESL